jgi:hypothetical protein
MMPTKKISSQCLSDFLAEDLTQAQIAKACSLTRQAIHARINYAKDPKRKERLMRHFSVVFLRRLGFTLPELIEYTGYCDSYIRMLFRRNNCISFDQTYTTKTTKKNTKIRHFQIRFLHRLGFSPETIAEYTGYKYGTVRQYLHEFGY